jgi:hypothetical protein
MKSIWLAVITLGAASFAGCTDSTTLYVAGDENDEKADVQCKAENQQTYYADADGDGYGDPADSTASCVALQGHVKDNTDCDDLEGFAYPGGLEVCGDEIDNDCNAGDSCVGSRAARWAFTAVDGATIVDESGFQLLGTLEGGLLNTPAASLAFDGVDDYAMITDQPTYQLAEGAVALWFYAEATNVQQGILSKDATGNGAGGHLAMYMDVGGSVRVALSSANQTYQVAALPVTPGQWHHLVFNFGGNAGMSLQVDGVLAGVDPYTGGLIRNNEPLVIGASTDTSAALTATPITQPFTGMVTEVQFYDRQLLEAELGELRMATAPVGAMP